MALEIVWNMFDAKLDVNTDNSLDANKYITWAGMLLCVRAVSLFRIIDIDFM